MPYPALQERRTGKQDTSRRTHTHRYCNILGEIIMVMVLGVVL